MTLTATPTKLRSGNWGARLKTSKVRAGDTVTITTRAGKTWQAKVTKVVWSGNGAAIVATESLDRPRHRTATRFGAGQAAAVPGYSSYCTDDHNCVCYDCI